MSSAVFPTLPGLTWPIQKKPVTSAIVQTTASGRELRSTSWSSPLFEWGLQFTTLRAKQLLDGGGVPYAEYETLAGFFNARGGRNENFLFVDPTDGTTYRVRFRDDRTDFANFMQFLWENRTIWIRQVKGET